MQHRRTPQSALFVASRGRRRARLVRGALLCLCLCHAAVAASAGVVWPDAEWARASPAELDMDAAVLERARAYALTGGGSGYIVRHGRVAMSWGDPRELYDLKSSTKSIGVTALGLAVLDGKMRLQDKAVRHEPSLGVPPPGNAETGWIEAITLQHLATHSAGFDKPGGHQALLFAPGTMWAYSDSGTNWLAAGITRAYGTDLQELMFARVFAPLGIGRRDLTWRKHEYWEPTRHGVPQREFGSGIRANADAMARIGYLYLRGGEWKGRRIVPQNFVDLARTAIPAVVGLPELDPESYGNASDHYGLLWWNNADGTLDGVPRDAYWSWGLYDSLIVVIPSLDVVAARAGRSFGWSWWKFWDWWTWRPDYQRLAPFLRPIVDAVHGYAAEAPVGR